MATNRSQDDYQKTAIRIPRDVHKAVHDTAKTQDRSFNGQLIALVRLGLQTQAAQANQPAGAAQ